MILNGEYETSKEKLYLDLDLVQEETQRGVAVPRSDLDLCYKVHKTFCVYLFSGFMCSEYFCIIVYR